MSQSSPAYVGGVDIGGTNLRFGLARVSDEDPGRSIVARSTASTVGIKEPAKVVELIRAGVAELLEKASVPKSSLRAIGIGAPGITNAETGVVIVTSYLLGWRDVPLRALIEEALGIPAAVDNDVNLAALGEHWAGAGKQTPSFVFLAIGTGIGAGIILDGQLFRGTTWIAGEVGYMLLPGLPGEPAAHGQPGALEGVLGGEGIKAQWQMRCNEATTRLPPSLHATEIFDRAIKGDPLAQTVLAKSGRMLASMIYNISLVLNCPLFILGGTVGLHPALRETATDVLGSWGDRVRPRIVPSSLGEDAQLFGAIRLALDTRAKETARGA